MIETYIPIESYVRERLELPKTGLDIMMGASTKLATIETPYHIRERDLEGVVEHFGFLGLPDHFYQFTPAFLMDSMYDVILSHFELRGFKKTRDFLPTKDSGTGVGFENDKEKEFCVEKGEERYCIKVWYNDLPIPDSKSPTGKSRIRSMGVKVRKILG